MKIIFLGSQGSGKSTQAQLAAKKLNLPWIEMGQIFREKAKDDDPQAQEVRRALDVGELVPDEIAIKTLHNRLSKPDCAKGYVLDGYPRNYAQIEGLDVDIDKVFNIKLSDNEGIKRSIERARFDDNLEVLTRRLRLYHQKTEPLLAYFRQKGLLVEINGDQPVEKVANDIQVQLENEFGKKLS